MSSSKIKSSVSKLRRSRTLCKSLSFKEGNEKKLEKKEPVVEDFGMEEEMDNFTLDSLILSEKEGSEWYVNILINGYPVRAKVDKGASVTVLPEEFIKKLKIGRLEKARDGRGPDNTIIPMKGQGRASFQIKEKKIWGNVMFGKVRKPLLGLIEIKSLGLLKEGNADSLEFPSMPGEYKIELKEDVVPWAETTSRRVPLPLYCKVEQEIKKLELYDIIVKEFEPTEWCSPMVVVKKTEGVRLCVDYQKLNKYIRVPKFPISSCQSTIARIKGKIFSKLDAVMGFHHIKLNHQSSKMTTFITPFGRYRFKRLPFGISSGPEVFQARLTQMLDSVKGVHVHIDDILITSETDQEHDERLGKVIDIMKKNNIRLNKEKCVFRVKKIKFLGYIISSEGVFPDPGRIEDLKRVKPPGKVNENLARYHEGKAHKINADASSQGLGAVLTQWEEGTWRPIAYASRALTKAERNYAPIEKEAMAVVWACDYFAEYVLGKRFEIETDHKPLENLLGKHSLVDLPLRIQRFKLKLQRYDFTIKYIPGNVQHTADFLSRSISEKKMEQEIKEDFGLGGEICTITEMIISDVPASDKRLRQIEDCTRKDPILAEVINYVNKGWPKYITDVENLLRPYYRYREDIYIWKGLIMYKERIIIPVELRREILDKLHDGHLGIVKTKMRAKSSVFWPGIGSQIEQLIDSCSKCSEYGMTKKMPLIRSKWPLGPWKMVATDLFTYDQKYYVIVVDYYSRFIEVTELTNQRASAVIMELKRIFARHGVPEILVSDNGPCYSSQEFSRFAKEWGFEQRFSAPKQPHQNGLAERGVQTVKNFLKKNGEIDRALLAYRAAPLQNGQTPAKLLYNREL
nr:uncharacterized protein K02A2.6-like [Lepeophtheirus salmonis]